MNSTMQQEKETLVPSSAMHKPLSYDCPVCGYSIGLRSWIDNNVYTYICNHCKTYHSWQWSSEEEYDKYYSDPTAYHVEGMKANGYKPFEERSFQLKTAARCREDLIEAIISPHYDDDILDIGTATGEFIKSCMEDMVTLARGIDPNPKFRTEYVSTGTWKDVKGQYNIITMFDVFEHLTRPNECIEHLKKCLTSYGVIVIEMPELYSPEHIKAGCKWKHIKPKEHIYLYSKEATIKLFEKHGFECFAFVRPLIGSLGKATYFFRQRNDST